MREVAVSIQGVLPIFRRFQAAGAIGIGAVIATKVCVMGFARIVGNFHLPAGGAPAAGFPRLVQMTDGITANPDLVDVIPQDLGQPDVQFPFDIEIKLPYIRLEYTHGGAGAAFLAGYAQAMPI